MELSLMRPDTTAILVCDVQAAFRNVIHEFQDMVSGIDYLTRLGVMLGCPVFATEQCPEKLGATVNQLNFLFDEGAASKRIHFFSKTRFTMLVPDLMEAIRKECPGLKSVILCGLETHICISQTCIELLGLGIRPYIAVDATSSTCDGERRLALQRMQSSGAVLTSVESAVFELLGDSGHPHFRDASKLIKEYNAGAKRLLTL